MSNEAKELAILRQQLAEAHATLDAIRRGEVDAVLVDLGGTAEVYTLQSADLPYREFLEQMAEGALSLDAGNTVLYCNRFLCELLGVRREDLVGQSLTTWLDPASRDGFEKAAAGDGPCTLAGTMVRADGDPLPVRLSITPAGVRGSRRTNVVVSDQRISRRLQHVTEARDAAEAASSAKDRFLAVLGHELRNPLAALTSAVSLLERGPVAEDRRTWIHGSMSRQLAQLKSLVDDLLDLTRVAQGKIVLKKELVSLAEIVAHAAEAVHGVIGERGHTLVLDGVPPGLTLEADLTRLEQIIVNLLSNAAKYSDPGSTITVSAHDSGDTVEIAVADTGVGLDAAHLEHIFEPFAQLTAEGAGGLGIGLTLVRQLVELHGGTIHAHSEGAGRGSTFHVQLPRGVAASRADSPVGPGTGPVSGLRVLLVDDNEDSVEMLGMLLESRGFDVAVAHTGAEVPDAVARHRPSLILLDLGLPDITGYDVARQLRRAGHDRTVLIALTGFSHDDARARVVDAGFDAHVVKPITFAQLTELIDQFRDRLD